jgi:lipopolysaccharide/colanic/teichoic acid biosynthesis glycosyltransferase
MYKNQNSRMYSIFKRTFDLSISIVGLLIIFPLFVVIIIFLQFTGESEIFYFQERMGVNNKVFHIYKFATMLKDSPTLGHKNLTIRNDPRITKLGGFLRRTKINELPQILNVLEGDMALVGPRPLLSQSFHRYNPEVQKIIYNNRPGITGIGSLIFRDEELLVSTYKELGKNPSDYYKKYIFPYKGSLELWYFYNRSLSVDFKILFLTFWSLVNPQSNLVYKILKNLPAKPDSLTVAGIQKL